MKLGVIADVHANRPALDATLNALDERGIDELVCVGDLVGVLGSPQYVVSTIRDRSAATVYGNHDSRFFDGRDWMPTRDVEVAEYEQVTAALSASDREWLAALPARTEYEGATLVHATPCGDDPAGETRGNAGVHPGEFTAVAADALGEGGGILLMGHTHHQHAIDAGKFDGLSGLVLNPGSVGFPFHHDTEHGDDLQPLGKASFAVVDTETQEYDLCNVQYDASAVVDHLERHGLHESRSTGQRGHGSMQTDHTP